MRPYRLHSTHLKGDIPHRYYSSLFNAWVNCLIECKFSPLGTTIQVYHNETAKVPFEYKNVVTGVKAIREIKIARPQKES